MEQVYFIRILLQKKWWIVLLGCSCVIATFILNYNKPKKFEAKAQLATGITQNEGPTDDESASNYFDSQIKFSNVIENISSKQTVNLLSYRLIVHDLTSKNKFKKLDDYTYYKKAGRLNKLKAIVFKDKTILGKFTDEELQNSVEKFQRKISDASPINPENEEDKFLEILLKKFEYDYEELSNQLHVDRVAGSDYVNIKFVAETPALAAFAANTILEEFLRLQRIKKDSIKDKSVVFFANLVSDKELELASKENDLQLYKIENKIVDITAQRSSMLDQISTLELAKEEEEKKIGGLNQALRNVNHLLSELNLTGAHRVINNDILEISDKISELNQEWINSRDEEIKKQIDALKEKLKIQLQKSTDISYTDATELKKELISKKLNYELELEISEGSLLSIKNSLDNLKFGISNYSEKDTRLLQLMRSVELAKNEYLEAVEKLNEAQYYARKLDSNMRIAEFAAPPNKPLSSKTIIFSGLAGILSVSIFISFLFLKEYFDYNYKTGSRFKKFTKLNLIGYINKTSITEKLLPVIFSKQMKNKNDELFKQQIRKIRHGIKSEDNKIILVSSLRESQGKSFFIASLAYSLSLLNKSVLIIDTNFKNNTLTQIFFINQSKGSNECDLKYIDKKNDQKLINQDIEDESLIDKSIIHQTFYQKVHIIANSGGKDSPSELLSGKNFKQLLDELSMHYDYLIMEGPSLNEYPDSRELEEYCDKVVAVFSADTKLTSKDKESVEYLNSLKGKFVGAVLNKVDSKHINIYE